MDKNKKKRPFLPIDGSESAHTLLIPLQKFKINHHTYKDPENCQDPSFIGREKLTYRLGKLLNNTTGSRGSYLIAGYRGSGKTSLINRVINQYKEGKQVDSDKSNDDKQKQVINININLGHDATLDTRHVLFNIINLLKKEFEDKYEKKKEEPFIIFIALLVSSFSLIVFLMSFYFSEMTSAKNNCNSNFQYVHITTSSTVLIKDCIEVKKNLNHSEDFMERYIPNVKESWNYISPPPKLFISFIVLAFVIFFIFPMLARSFQERLAYPLNRAIKRILKGFNINIELSKGVIIFELLKKITLLHDQVAYSFEKDVGVVALRTAGFGFKNTTKIPEMKEPQIELELLSFLEECNNDHFNIIMVFDELDKISLNVTEINTAPDSDTAQAKHSFKGEDETLDEWLYRRKRRMDSLLGSLKTLITLGQARFFLSQGGIC